MKTWLRNGAFGAVLALAGVAGAQDTQMERERAKTQPGTMAPQDMRQQQGMAGQQMDGIQVAGVVTDVKGNMITVVTPLESEAEVEQIGEGAYLIDRQTQLVAFSGQIGKNTQVMLDGKTAKASDIKEGDVIRTSWDPQQESFGSLEVTSKKKIGEELKKESKTMKKQQK